MPHDLVDVRAHKVRSLPPPRMFQPEDPDYPTTEGARRLLERAGRVRGVDGAICRACHNTLVDDETADMENRLCTLCAPSSRSRCAHPARGGLSLQSLSDDEARLAIGMYRRRRPKEVVSALNERRRSQFGDGATPVNASEVLAVLREGDTISRADGMVREAIKAAAGRMSSSRSLSNYRRLCSVVLGIGDNELSAILAKPTTPP